MIYHNTKNVGNFPKNIFPFDYCLLFCQQSWFVGTNMPIWRLNLTHFYQGTTLRFHILRFFKGRRVSAAFCPRWCPKLRTSLWILPGGLCADAEGRQIRNKNAWNMIQMMYTSTVSCIRFQKCMSDSEGCTGLLGTRDVLSGLSLDWFIWFYMTTRASSKYQEELKFHPG